ncbi:MAG: lysophospholipid acyltransferase family protein [Caldilineaceae bacterium]
MINRAKRLPLPQSKGPQLTYTTPGDPLLKSLLIRSVEQLGGVRKLEKRYAKVLDRYGQTGDFWQLALEELDIRLDYERNQLAKIPRIGPLIFIANHPFGLLDGLIMCHLATVARGDFRIMLHSALCREERIARFVLPINFDKTAEATQSNIQTKQRALDYLRGGGTMVIFPAGGISTSTGLIGPVTDLEWKLFFTKLIQMTEATVAPIYFHGHNSRLFQVISQFSETLRLSLIVHEVHNKIGHTLRVAVGDPIPYAQIAHIKKRRELIAYLRMTIYELGNDVEKGMQVGKMSERY